MSVVDIKVLDDRFSFVTDNNFVYSIRKQVFTSLKSPNDFSTRENYNYHAEIIQNFNHALESFQNNSDLFKFDISLSKEGRPCLKVSEKSINFDKPCYKYMSSYEINLDKFYDYFEWMMDLSSYDLNYDLNEFVDVLKYEKDRISITFHLSDNSEIVIINNRLKYYNSQPNHYFEETEQLINDQHSMKIKIEKDHIILCIIDSNNEIIDVSFLNLQAPQKIDNKIN